MVLSSVGSETEELDVLSGVVGVVQKTVVKRIFTAADCVVLPLHCFAEESAILNL